MNGEAQGNPNYVYYKLAAMEYGVNGNSACNSSKENNIATSCVFNDVTLGDIDMDCTNAVDCYKPSGDIGVEFDFRIARTSRRTMPPSDMTLRLASAQSMPRIL